MKTKKILVGSALILATIALLKQTKKVGVTFRNIDYLNKFVTLQFQSGTQWHTTDHYLNGQDQNFTFNDANVSISSFPDLEQIIAVIERDGARKQFFVDFKNEYYEET